MGKATPDAVLDAPLESIAEADTIYVCSDEPADFAGIAAVALASGTLTPGDGNGDFTIGAGDVSGRQVTIAQQADLAIGTSGEADHGVVADAEAQGLKRVMSCTPHAVPQGVPLRDGSYEIAFGDPKCAPEPQRGSIPMRRTTALVLALLLAEPAAAQTPAKVDSAQVESLLADLVDGRKDAV